ncbi:MAG: bifunctional biotin--[acetyl-CoA-carboxylase] ligase/biotin operon repressor BirA [Chromatocurvus sp.]
MSLPLPLLQILADGHFHSGEALGTRLGITRAAIWKQLRRVEALGLTLQAVRGRGYRLAYPVEFLQAEILRQNLPAAIQAQLAAIDILPEIDSTNTYLMTRAAQGAASGSICLAEWQHAGRGRLGRTWVSPFGCNLSLSLLWRFTVGPTALTGLSLAMGVALARALRASGADGLGLKWPNDLQWRGRKLGGILVEIAGESSGPSLAVIGVGINVRMPETASGLIQQPWIDLARIVGVLPSRNVLAACVLEHLVNALNTFERYGLPAFLDDWRAWDVTAGQGVHLHLPTGIIAGESCGIDETGALLIRVGNDLRRYASGEITLRMDA